MVHYVMKTQMLILCRKFAMTFDKRKWGEGGGDQGSFGRIPKILYIIGSIITDFLQKGPSEKFSYIVG